MRIFSLGIFLVFPPLFALPISAQTSIPGYRLLRTPTEVAGIPTGWSSSAAAGSSFQALFVGKLISQWDPDGVFLRGGELQVSAAMASRDSVLLLQSNVTGALLLPGQGPGGLDAILATDATGAQKWTWSASSGAFVGASVSLSGWGGANTLRLGAGNAIYALDSNKTSILRATVSGGQFTAVTPALTLTSTGRDIQPLYWDTDAVEDLAVLTSTSILVRSTAQWSGSFVPGYTVSANDMIAVSHGHGVGERDILAWYTELGGQGYVEAWNSSRTDQVLVLGAQCKAIACFDNDFDSTYTGVARDDLLLAAANSRDVYLFQRRPPAEAYSFWLPTFTSGQAAPYFFENDVDTSAPIAGTAIAGGDIDGDGDNDALMGVPDRNLLECALNGRIERHSFVPADLSASYSYDAHAITISYGQGPLTNATHLEVEIRSIDGNGTQPLHGPTTPVKSGEANGLWYLPLPTNPPNAQQVIVLSGVNQLDVYQFIVREVVRDAQGTVTARYPTKTIFAWYWSTVWYSLHATSEISQYPMPPEPPHETQAVGSPNGGVTPGGGGVGP